MRAYTSSVCPELCSEANPHANGNLPGLFFFYELSPIKARSPGLGQLATMRL